MSSSSRAYNTRTIMNIWIVAFGFFVCIRADIIYNQINSKKQDTNTIYKNLLKEAVEEQAHFNTMKNELRMALQGKNYIKEQNSRFRRENIEQNSATSMQKGHTVTITSTHSLPPQSFTETPFDKLDSVNTYKQKMDKIIDNMPIEGQVGAQKLHSNWILYMKILENKVNELTKQNNDLDKKCKTFEVLLGGRKEIEQLEDLFWTETLKFMESKDRFWKLYISLSILKTSEAVEWRESIKEAGFTIEQFCSYSNLIFDELSQRYNREIIVPKECLSLKAFEALLTNGRLNFLDTEERVVLSVILKMRIQREQKIRARKPITASSTDNVIDNYLGKYSKDHRCVILNPIQFIKPTSYTTENPEYYQSGPPNTVEKSPIYLPRSIPDNEVKMIFPEKNSILAMEYMCEIQNTYNPEKQTGSILVRFGTTREAAEAIITRDTTRTKYIDIALVNCMEYEKQQCSSRNHIYVYKFVNTSPRTSTQYVGTTVMQNN